MQGETMSTESELRALRDGSITGHKWQSAVERMLGELVDGNGGLGDGVQGKVARAWRDTADLVHEQATKREAELVSELAEARAEIERQTWRATKWRADAVAFEDAIGKHRSHGNRLLKLRMHLGDEEFARVTEGT